MHTAKRMQSNGRGACCAVAKTVSMENLDAIVAEVARMEEVSPVCLHLSTLLKKRNELLQKRAALPDSKTLMQDRAAGAEKRKKQAVRGLGLRWVRGRVRPLLPLRVRLSPPPRLASRQRKLSGRRGGGLDKRTTHPTVSATSAVAGKGASVFYPLPRGWSHRPVRDGPCNRFARHGHRACSLV